MWCDGLLHAGRLRWCSRHSGRRVRRSTISKPNFLGLRGTDAFVGVHASRHRAHGVGAGLQLGARRRGVQMWWRIAVVVGALYGLIAAALGYAVAPFTEKRRGA